MPLKRVALLLVPVLLGAVLATVMASTSRGAAAERFAQRSENPCITPRAKRLLCPDLEMSRPYGLYTDRDGGRTLLRAGNSINSIGRGPAELFGVRTSPTFMKARQRIYKRGGGKIGVTTGARLQFKFAHLNRRWWKFFHAARFELWRLNKQGRRGKLVRTGPKVAYCLRDLRRTRAFKRSPRNRVYPACNTSSRTKKVRLGTSVGWSDIYPPTYPEQWINVTGLRGCFAYVHIADPKNGIYESNEDNNEAQVIVRLPYKPGKQRCPRAGANRPGPDPGY